jgi:hypothetical protein
MAAAAGFSTSRKSRNWSQYYYYYYRMYEWFYRNKSLLLALNVISIILLFLIHPSILAVQINPASIAAKIIQTITLSLISIIALSIMWRGIICIAIGILGLFLIYAGILLPSYSLGLLQESNADGKNQIRSTLNINQPISVASQGLFFLGIAMVALSMIFGYRPEILYVKNRPKPLDTMWESYSIWHDDYDNHVKLVGGYSEPIVHLKNLMTDEEIYLLWRYEYILTDVHGTPHLVKPESYVPESSTIFRDKKSGKMIGKAKYVGYFI